MQDFLRKTEGDRNNQKSHSLFEVKRVYLTNFYRTGFSQKVSEVLRLYSLLGPA